MSQFEKLQDLLKDKPNIGQDERNALVQKTCDLLQCGLFEDLKFLSPVSFETSYPEMVSAEAQKIAKKRKTETGPAEFADAGKAVDEKLAQKIPQTARIDKSDGKPGNIEELLLHEYLLDYSTLKETKRPAGQERLLMLFVACKEYTRINGKDEHPMEVIERHGLEISADVLVKKDKTETRPKKRNPLLTILAERYVDSFSNHIILTQVRKLNSKLELKLLTIADAYYSLIKNDPRELPARNFLENPEKYTDKKKLLEIVREYEQKFDKETGEIKNESDKIRKKHENGINSTKQKDLAQTHYNTLDGYIKRAEQFHHDALITELNGIKNGLAEKLREYASKVNMERAVLSKNKLDILELEKHIGEIQTDERNPTLYTRIYQTYKGSIDIKEKEVLASGFEELNDIREEIKGKVKEISNSLSDKRTKLRDSLKSKLEKECTAIESTEGKSLEEKTQLEKLIKDVAEETKALTSISECKTEHFEKSLKTAQNKIRAYDEKVQKVAETGKTLQNLLDRATNYSGELTSTEFIKFHKEITAIKNESSSYLSRIHIDNNILPVKNTCDHLILKINNKLGEMKESLEAKIKKMLSNIKTIVERKTETVDELNEIKECERQLQFIDDASTYFSMKDVFTQEDKGRIITISQKEQAYHQLKKDREDRLNKYTSKHETFIEEIKDLFGNQFSTENIEAFKSKIGSAREKAAEFEVYRRDRSLEQALEKNRTTLTKLEGTFKETLGKFINNLQQEYKNISEKLSKNSRNTTQAIRELTTLNSRLDSLEQKISTLLTTHLSEDAALKSPISESKQIISSAIKGYETYLRNKIEELNSAELLIVSTTKKITKLMPEVTVAYDDWKKDPRTFENTLQTNRRDIMDSTNIVLSQKHKYDQVSQDEGLVNHTIAKTLQTYAKSLESIINKQLQNANQQIKISGSRINSEIKTETQQGIEKVIEIRKYANSILTHVQEQEKLSKSGYKIDHSASAKIVSAQITTCNQIVSNYESLFHNRRTALDGLCSEYTAISTSYEYAKSLKQKINEFEANITKYMKLEKDCGSKSGWKEDNALKTDFEKVEKTRTQTYTDLEKAHSQLLSEADGEIQKYLQLKIEIHKSWLKTIFLSPKLAYYTVEHHAAVNQKARLNPEFSPTFGFKEYLATK